MIIVYYSNAQKVVNQYDFDKSFSYNIADSSMLIGYERGEDQLIYYKEGKTDTLKGTIGHFSKKGKYILTLEKKRRSCVAYLYNKKGELLRSKEFNEPLSDINFGKNKRKFYGLVETSEVEDISDGEVVELSRKFKIKKHWSTYSPKHNSVNLCYHAGTKMILVGAGLKGVFLTTKGDSIMTYETPNTGIVQSHNKNHFSILHQYSDGSSLEFFTSKNESVDIMKSLDKKYPVDFDGYTVRTSIPVFQSWDINELGTQIVTLDHSKAISLFDKNGEYVKDLETSTQSDFIFFVDNNTIGCYDLEIKKLSLLPIK